MSIIPRLLAAELQQQLREFPIVTILGPRQAGKTTLARETLPAFAYVSLEDPSLATLATEDPKGFLASFPPPVIYDEIQRVPQLLRYLQVAVDEQESVGQYVLTGSHQLDLRASISQSLAGRTGMLTLLPLSLPELAACGRAHEDFAHACFHGFLPRVFAFNQRPTTAYSSYYQTYVERDVRQLINLKDASLFDKCIRLVAGRVGQVIDYSSLAGDVGVDARTIRSWLGILEASFVVMKLPPYFENFGKRLIKSPKYYFTDVGLLAWLLGIEKPSQIPRDPLVGGMFENLIVLEAWKARLNQGQQPNCYFFRDSNGTEIDLLHASGRRLTAVEIKSAATFHPRFAATLQRFHQRVAPLDRRAVIYNGEALSLSDGIQVLPFARSHEIFT